MGLFPPFEKCSGVRQVLGGGGKRNLAGSGEKASGGRCEYQKSLCGASVRSFLSMCTALCSWKLRGDWGESESGGSTHDPRPGRDILPTCLAAFVLKGQAGPHYTLTCPPACEQSHVIASKGWGWGGVLAQVTIVKQFCPGL